MPRRLPSGFPDDRSPLANERVARSPRSPIRVGLPASIVFSCLLGVTGGVPAQTPSPPPLAPAPPPSTPPSAPTPSPSPPAAQGAPAATPGTDTSPDTSEPEEKTIVITATRTPQPKQSVSTPVETITKKEIENSDARNAAELLGERSLVDIRSYGGLAGLQLPSLRGMNPDEVLVLIDGRRLNPPFGGGVDLSDIDLEGIRKVEVLRGPASALYGSDAMGGVIQFLTEIPEGPARTSLKEEAGSYGYDALRFSRSETIGKIAYVISARHVAWAGDYPYYHPDRMETLRRNNDDLDNNAVRATLIPELPGKGQLRLNYDWSDGKEGTPGPIQSPSTGHQYDRIAALDLDYQLAGDDSPPHPASVTELRAYSQGQERLYNALMDPIPSYTLQKVYTDGFEATHRQDWRVFSLTGGFETREERLDASNISNKNREVLGTYVLGQVGRGRWSALPAVRWDQVETVGSQVSPQIGVLEHLSSSWTFRSNLGRGFRAPSFDDLYWPEDAYEVGNPLLKPERSTTADLGFGYARGPWNVDLTGYHTLVNDLIVWTPGAGPQNRYEPINVGRARLHGLELTSGHRMGRWGVRAGGSLLNAEDRTPGSITFGKQLTYRPSSQGQINLDWQGSRWGTGIDLVGSGRRYSSPTDTSQLAGYTLVNLRIHRRFGSWSAGLDLDDLFDTRYVIEAGYPLPGRQAVVSLQQRF